MTTKTAMTDAQYLSDLLKAWDLVSNLPLSAFRPAGNVTFDQFALAVVMMHESGRTSSHLLTLIDAVRIAAFSPAQLEDVIALKWETKNRRSF